MMIFLQTEQKNKQIFPCPSQIFCCFEWTPLHELKVVFVGQVCSTHTYQQTQTQTQTQT